MCGVMGFFGDPDRTLLESMATTLAHRGPDDEGFFESPEISLGFRRLSIIDLAGGHQPMSTEDGQVWIAYNGEIYNYRELRSELIELGQTFRTQSDTEVFLKAYVQWGTEAFSRLNGMWGVAIADLRVGQLVLSRDRLGVKPMYVAQSAGRMLFGSEIKALLKDPSLHTRPNDQIVYEYLAFGLHDHRKETFFEGIWRLPAAHFAIIDQEGYRETRYWTPKLGYDANEPPDQFRARFRRSVERRLVADVPVGTCLSGGLDSSTIVSLMTGLLSDQVDNAQSMRGRVKTFSAVFDGDPIDEREFIEEEIRASGADSLYIRPTSREFAAEMADLVYHQDEPFVSTGPYAQYCVLRESAKHVKVVLDGQGGDELLAGYVPYQFVYLRQLWRQRQYVRWFKEAILAADVLWPLARRALASRGKHLPIGSLLRQSFVEKMEAPHDTRPSSSLKERLLQDLTTYSLPALLRYEDRNSMAHSLESRVPWMDPELVETILRLPESSIIHGGWSRSLLRQAMRGVLPEKIRRRRWKVGFTTPEHRWLFARRAVFLSFLRSPLFASRPYWHGPAVAETFRRALAGKVDPGLFFWRVINVEAWLRIFFGGEDPAHVKDLARLADETTARSLGDHAQRMVAAVRANQGRHLLAQIREEVWLRAPLRTGTVKKGDNLTEIVQGVVQGLMEPGDVLAISERVVAISQGRSYPLADVHPTRFATFLSHFVRRTPSGIGLGVPETMELARREIGATRLAVAAAAAAVTRPLGIKGVFYRLVGPEVAAIDGPTHGTLPPYDGHAKLAPADPNGVARHLAEALGGGVRVAIVDVNDIGANVLGHTADIDPQFVRELLRDNPLGQGSERTPIALMRKLA